MALSIAVEDEVGRARVRLAGSIDEHAELDATFGTLERPAVLDLSKVERVNSLGLLRWVRAIGPLTSRCTVEVEAISYPMCIQANQVSDLFGKALLRSCIAPYFCPKCRAAREALVTREEILAAEDGVPIKRCEACATPMEFDEVDEYFLFLKDRG
jgi:hypothetical protein